MSNRMQCVVRCADWQDFKRKISSEVQGTTPRIYRGQADSRWPLASRFERMLAQLGDISRLCEDGETPHQFICRLRDSFLRRFRQILIGLPAFDPSPYLRDDEQTSPYERRFNEKDKNAWALGRHYGLVSPILDWTTSPYVAAFFAFHSAVRSCATTTGQMHNLSLGDEIARTLEKEEGSVAVFELIRQGHFLTPGQPTEERLEIPGELEVFRCKLPDATRQFAQQGCYTWLHHTQHFDLESYLKSRGLEHCLTKYEIPLRSAAEALYDLHLMNIDHAKLYQDLQGAALHANYAYKFDRGYRNLRDLRPYDIQDEDTHVGA